MSTSTVEIQATFPDGAVAAEKVAIMRRVVGSEAWKWIGIYYTRQAIKVDEFLVGTSYEVAVAPVSRGNDVAPESSWTVEKFIPKGNTATPPAVSRFTAVQDEEWVMLDWKGVAEKMRTEDFKHYEIRLGSAWAGSELLGRITTEAFKHKWGFPGSHTYRICTIDKAGVRSSEVTATVTVTALRDTVEGSELDEDTGGFTGTKSGMEVDTGVLVPSRWGSPATSATETADTATWLPRGPYEVTYTSAEKDLGSARLIRLEPEINFTVDGDMADENADTVLETARVPYVAVDGTHQDVTSESSYAPVGKMIAAGDESHADFRLYIRYGTASATGSYVPFIPGWYYCRYYTLKLYVWLWNRWRRVKFSRLRMKEWKRNRKDEGIIAIAGAGNTTITFTTVFIDNPAVTAIVDIAGHFCRVTNISTTGCDITVYDDTGSAVNPAGNIHWHALGT